MSQIFDALQRSECERSGTGVAELSAATDLLEVAERQIAQSSTGSDLQQEIATQTEEIGPAEKLDDYPFSEFKSLRALLPPQSKLVSITEEDSLAAEKFRFLAVRLRHLQQKRPFKRLLLTSSVPEEGKSTIAANLACTLAKRQRQKVLLLDGDLRRPTLGLQFGVGKIPGLCETLEGEPGETPINIYKVEDLGLWFLPAGNPPRDPLELIQSGKLSGLLDQLGGWFDWIVIDSPPVLPLGDTSVWMRLTEAMLLVTRPGSTAKRQLQRALEAVEQPKLLGALINGSKEAARGGYYHYYAPKTTGSKASRSADKLINVDQVSQVS
jgi:capsular exopolysaccharide synthesis family protein